MPRPDVSEERIQQIIEAALTVFAREGFAQARMEDIAQTAGISKGAIYLYFKSKDAIIGSILKFIFRQELRLLQNYPITDAPITEQVMRLTRQLAGALDRMQPFMPIIFEFYAVAGRQKDVHTFLVEHYSDFQDIFTALIQAGVDRGELQTDDPNSVALTLLALYEGLTLFWAIDPQGVDWRDQAESSVRLILAGLQAPPAS